ncbi:hypothetical protein L484_016278 [Morus notabilis]|uniref:Uncharacterized protein n=1 Tax=Morus notabilis TaxID=981085 RepID=W9RQ10_9ROSA|nr:hypothetical protein L484_016278 [Morus notabilis]
MVRSVLWRKQQHPTEVWPRTDRWGLRVAERICAIHNLKKKKKKKKKNNNKKKKKKKKKLMII